MGLKLTIDELAPDDALRDYGVGALIRWERGTAVGGPFVEQGTRAILAGIYQYEIDDPTGTNAHFYRTRRSNAAGNVLSNYGPVFSPSQPESYANLDELLLAVRQPVTDTKWLANASQRLKETTRDLIREIGYSFFVSSTETRRYHGNGSNRLHVHEGIVTLTSVEIQLTQGGSWTLLAATDYYLEGQPDETYQRPGEPSFHVVLESQAAYSTFPTIKRGVRLTGTFGWPAILVDARGANVAWTRQLLAADPSLPGGPTGPEELGNPIGPDRWPRAVYDLIMAERQRFWCSL